MRKSIMSMFFVFIVSIGFVFNAVKVDSNESGYIALLSNPENIIGGCTCWEDSEVEGCNCSICSCCSGILVTRYTVSCEEGEKCAGAQEDPTNYETCTESTDGHCEIESQYTTEDCSDDPTTIKRHPKHKVTKTSCPGGGS